MAGEHYPQPRQDKFATSATCKIFKIRKNEFNLERKHNSANKQNQKTIQCDYQIYTTGLVDQ